MIIALITEIKVVLIDTVLNKKVHVFLYDYFREFCITNNISFIDFRDKRIGELCDSFNVEKVKYMTEAELRLAMV